MFWYCCCYLNKVFELLKLFFSTQRKRERFCATLYSHKSFRKNVISKIEILWEFIANFSNICDLYWTENNKHIQTFIHLYINAERYFGDTFGRGHIYWTTTTGRWNCGTMKLLYGALALPLCRLTKATTITQPTTTTSLTRILPLYDCVYGGRGGWGGKSHEWRIASPAAATKISNKTIKTTTYGLDITFI